MKYKVRHKSGCIAQGSFDRSLRAILSLTIIASLCQNKQANTIYDMKATSMLFHNI